MNNCDVRDLPHPVGISIIKNFLPGICSLVLYHSNAFTWDSLNWYLSSDVSKRNELNDLTL